jgi:hypothetical protein
VQQGRPVHLFETRGRTIDEIDSTLTAKGPVGAPVKAPAV